MARRRRSPARWLAPLALIACAGAIYAVVHDDGPTTARKPAVAAAQRRGAASTGRKAVAVPRRHRTYTVRAGDTLSSIAVKTGVPLATIQRLNPKLDAQSLHAGEKVKLAASSP
jgi:spore germination protein YaaH